MSRDHDDYEGTARTETHAIVDAVGALVEAASPGCAKPETIPNPSGRGLVAIVRDGFEVKEIDGPKKAVREHVFHDIASLADWLKAKAKPETTEVLVGTERIVAALEPQALSSDTVTTLLLPHPMWALWSGALGKKLTQRQFHGFIRGVVDQLGDAGDILSAEIARVGLKGAKDVDVELDERGFYRFQGQTNRSEISGRIPPKFEVFTPILGAVCDPDTESEKQYLVEILLSIDVEDAGVFFTMTCPKLDILKYQARLDAVAWLRHLAPEFKVGLGDIKLAEKPEYRAVASA